MRRDKILTVTLTPDEKQKVKTGAELSDLPMAGYIRGLIRDDCRRRQAAAASAPGIPAHSHNTGPPQCWEFLETLFHECLVPRSQVPVQRLVENLLAILQPREREVIVCRYGLEDGHSQTYKQIAERFNVTIEQIRQVHQKAFRRMQHPLHRRETREVITSAEHLLSPQRHQELTRQNKKLRHDLADLQDQVDELRYQNRKLQQQVPAPPEAYTLPAAFASLQRQVQQLQHQGHNFQTIARKLNFRIADNPHLLTGL